LLKFRQIPEANFDDVEVRQAELSTTGASTQRTEAEAGGCGQRRSSSNQKHLPVTWWRLAVAEDAQATSPRKGDPAVPAPHRQIAKRRPKAGRTS